MAARFDNRNTKTRMPMQYFTQEDFQPRKSSILFVKQFARMYVNAKNPETMKMCLN
jgi:hypothetical protein